MVILSQDKKRMFNFENLVEIRVFTHNSYPLKDNVKGYDLQGVTQDGKYIILGIYDTEERAKHSYNISRAIGAFWYIVINYFVSFGYSSISYRSCC